MTPITPELKLAIAQAGDAPARFVDPETNATYLLVREGDVVILPIDSSGELSESEMTRLMWDVMKDEWDDHRMDVYDDLVGPVLTGRVRSEGR